MGLDHDAKMIVLMLVGVVAGIVGSLIMLRYMLKYSSATAEYMKTQDSETWKRSIRKEAGKASILMGVAVFIAIMSCTGVLFVDIISPLDTAFWRFAGFAVLAAILTSISILVHSRWLDFLRKILKQE